MSLSNVFRKANIWKTFVNSKSSSVKFRQKGVFFFENWTIWCRGFVCMSSVFVDVEVVFALRPSTRLCLEESSVNSMYFSMLRLSFFSSFNSSFCWTFDFFIDFNPYLDIRLYNRLYIRLSLRIYVVKVEVEVRWGRGGNIRGVLHKGFKGEEKRGERRVGRRRREEKEFMHFKSWFSSQFRCVFRCMCEWKLNLSKKSFSNFWFFNFFAIYLPCEWMKRMTFESEIRMFNF